MVAKFMVGKIWGFFIIIGSFYSIITGKVESLNKQILDSTKSSFEMILQILPVMGLWLGIMNIAKKAGLIDKFAILLEPILSFLFPEIPKKHESLTYISSNIIANMFGLGNAATPFGLKAMKSLQEINKDKNVASRSMITFLVINTAGVTIIPTTVISMRMLYGSTNPTAILIPCLIVTFVSLVVGIIFDRMIAKNDKSFI
jgi:spore maturation protein A